MCATCECQLVLAVAAVKTGCILAARCLECCGVAQPPSSAPSQRALWLISGGAPHLFSSPLLACAATRRLRGCSSATTRSLGRPTRWAPELAC